MPFADIGRIRLAYETFGSPSDPPIVLVMGLGSQMLAWRTGFCEQLASNGFRVVRFDNRDIGLSSRIGTPKTQALWTLTRRRLGHRVPPPYRLADMADDVVGLMDALRIPAAHLVGSSMGGMIAQLCAINHRPRVLSLTSMMSTTGDPDLPGPDWRVRQWYLRPVSDQSSEQVEDLIRITRLVGSRKLFDERDVRSYFTRVVARSADRSGVPRQVLALLTAPSRRGGLTRLVLPSLVIHGLDDTMLPPAHGVRTAKTIPQAKLQLIPALGHDLPRALWSELAARISEHVASARGPVLRLAAWRESSTKKTVESLASR